MGSPKPIINKFESVENPAGKEEAKSEEPAGSSNMEEAANSIIDDAKEMYLKIIEEANGEAKATMEAAESDAHKLKAASKEEGYKEGYETGYSEGRKEAQSVIDEAVGLREFLDERKENIFMEAEEQIMQLVLQISEKVIGDEIKQNKEAILSLVNMALQKCAFKKKLILKVSTQDYDFIIENKEQICMMAEGISDIDIVSDLSLAQGGCIVETPSGEINSSIDVQIKEINKIFNYLLRNE
jgi:flagellar assembly protein FliH